MLNLIFLGEKGMIPQFAAAKLHLICQTTKILAKFLQVFIHFARLNAFYLAFSALFI